METEPLSVFPVGMGESPRKLTSRKFTYYFQNMNGSSALWNEMLGRLTSEGEINGAVCADGETIVWSENAPSHELLTRAFSEEHRKYGTVPMDAKMDREGQVRIRIYTKDDEIAEKWQKYLTRCGLNPDLILRGSPFALHSYGE